MNKYQRTPNYILDLHGHTTQEAKVVLDELVDEGKYSYIRIITGKGLHSPNGPVLRDFIKSYLEARRIHFTQSKIQDGGEGALEVFLKI